MLVPRYYLNGSVLGFTALGCEHCSSSNGSEDECSENGTVKHTMHAYTVFGIATQSTVSTDGSEVR